MKDKKQPSSIASIVKGDYEVARRFWTSVFQELRDQIQEHGVTDPVKAIKQVSALYWPQETPRQRYQYEELACPFCGDEGWTARSGPVHWQVVCENCGARGPTSTTKDDAVILFQTGV